MNQGFAAMQRRALIDLCSGYRLPGALAATARIATNQAVDRLKADKKEEEPGEE
jgi:hypothetical protein